MTGARSGPVQSDRGQPRLFGGVDVGGSKVLVLIVDDAGRIVGRVHEPMGRGRHQASVGTVFATLRRAVEETTQAGRLAAIGVGVPGRVDRRSGVVRLAVNLGWSDLPLCGLLSAEFDVPCWIENSVHVAAGGLLERDEAADVRSLAFVNVGMGVGAGIVLDGHVYRGSRGMAGEIGHFIVEPEGRRCACGLRGCLETVAAGPAIARLGQEAVEAGLATSLAGAGSITPTAIYEAARQGDVVALAIAGEVGRALARGIELLVATYDVERVILGGGVTRVGEPFLSSILAELASYRQASPLAAELLPDGIVRVLPPDFDETAWGAIVLARSELERQRAG